MQDSTTAWLLPWSALGAPEGEAAAPRCFALRPARQDDALALACGSVRTPEGLLEEAGRATRAVAWGLYCEETFGPLARTATGERDLAPRRAVHPRELPQGLRSGRLDLPPVINPWVRRFGQHLLTDATGLNAPQVAGASATELAAAASDRGRELPGLLRGLPVLAAGLRPVVVVEGVARVPGLTRLYEAVLRQRLRCEALETGASPGLRAREERLLQRWVDALVLDGARGGAELHLSAEDGPAVTSGAAVVEEGQEVASLAQLLNLGGQPAWHWVRELERLLEADGAALTSDLSAPLYRWRALVEAACLEVVPLDEDGAVDEARLAEVRLHRKARLLEAIYDQVLEVGPEDTVFHVPGSARPHVDVSCYRVGADDGGPLLVTAGMSAAWTSVDPSAGPEASPPVELCCQPDEVTEAVLRKLWCLAQHPFRQQAALVPYQIVQTAEPLAPGSTLQGWLLLPARARWAERLAAIVPGSPRLLLAVGITDDERRAATSEGGARALAVALLQATGGRTLFHRGSVWPRALG